MNEGANQKWIDRFEYQTLALTRVLDDKKDKSAKGTITVVNRKFLPERGAKTVRFHIDRPHPLGNPFFIGIDGSREYVIKKYRLWLQQEYCSDSLITPLDMEIMRIHQSYLEGNDVELVCNCEPAPCHGDVIKELIESLYEAS